MRIKNYLMMPFRRMARSFLAMVLTSHGRRMMLVASLYGHFKQIDVKKEKHEEFLTMVDEIDELFKITDKHRRALMLGLILHRNIWGKTQIPTKQDIDLYGKEILYDDVLKEIPPWLRYNKGVLKADVSFLIQLVSNRHVIVK